MTPPYSRIALGRAIAAMQLTSWRNSMMRGLSRDAIAGALGLIFGGASALVSIGFGLGAFVISGFGGDDPFLQFWFFAGGIGSLTLVSTLSGASGESGDLAGARMLQVYPVRRRDLFALDVAAQLFAPTLIFFLPAALGLAAGITIAHAQAGRFPASFLPVPAMLAALIATALLLRVIAGVVVIGGRRVRETLVVALTVLFLGLTFLGPAMQGDRLSEIGRRVANTEVLVRLTHVGAAADLATGPGAISLVFDLAVLGIWLGALWFAHEKITGRILDGETGTSPTRRKAARSFSFAPSIFSGPVAAAAIADFRTMTRIPTVWIQLLMPGLFGLLIGRSSHSAGSSEEAEIAATWTPVMAAFGAQVFFTSPLFSNLFGSDHAGASHYVLAPAPAWRILAGKTASRLLFAAAQVGVFFLAVSFRLGGGEPRAFAFAFAAWLSGALWVAAAGAFISIRLPYRVSHGLSREIGNRLLSSLLAQFLVATVMIPPALMIVGGRAFRGDAGYAAGIAVSALAGAILWALAAVWCSELWPTWGPRMAEELSQRSAN